MLHRGDLHGVLADAVRARKPDAIKLGRRCAGHRRTADGMPRCTFEDGETVRAAYRDRRRRHPLQGARSACSAPTSRSSPAASPGAGWCRWSKLPSHISRSAAAPTGSGRSGHVLHYPVRRGEMMNFVSFVERDDWQVESWVTQGTEGRARQRFPRLARGRARDHPQHRDAVQMGDDGARRRCRAGARAASRCWATPAIRRCRSSARAA